MNHHSKKRKYNKGFLNLDSRVWPGAVFLLVAFLFAWICCLCLPAILLAIALLGHLLFFRDPPPKAPAGGEVISPGSGRVISIDLVNEGRFLHNEAWKIRIFLALWNVHVTRSPMDGEIVYQEHTHGKHLNALLKIASEYNESNWIGIQRENRKVLVRQMTGAIARHIYSDVFVGDQVLRGGKLGIICYGSGVEIYIPKRLFEPTVRVGDHVKVGMTPIGKWANEAAL
ncbi:MAG: phosphatidylserine decarboxylase [Candidatus Omnitrophota bacterium]|jgi:phosphatidylserine decarboxylase